MTNGMLVRRAAHRAGREDGSIFLPIVFFMFALMVSGIGLYLGGHSGALQAQAQSGADAAALAAAREVRNGIYDAYTEYYYSCLALTYEYLIEACVLSMPTAESMVGTVSEGAVQGAASEFAGRNQTDLIWLDHLGMEVVAMVNSLQAVPVPCFGDACGAPPPCPPTTADCARPGSSFHPRGVARAVVILKDANARVWYYSGTGVPSRQEFGIFRLVPTGSVRDLSLGTGFLGAGP